MKINEIFYSLQGEGFLAGTPSVFIRLAGCPLRCRFCDTKYAWDPDAGTDNTIPKIMQTIQQHNTRFIVITGGEPMIASDLAQLTKQLKSSGKHITIETSGIAFIPDLACDLMSISPKLSNSTPSDPAHIKMHEDARLDLAVLSELIDNYQYQLKFVVDSTDDLPEIQNVLEKIKNVDSEKVMLMPQAKTRDELLDKSQMVADLCKHLSLAFSPRLQILLYNNQRGM